MNIKKFWLNINIREKDDCWEWLGRKTDYGYGRINNKLSHRIVYQLSNNIILTKYNIIRHTCDNPSCCNPSHLLIGTHQDNVKDRVSRNRSAKGEEHGRSKLSDSDVLEIRNLYENCKYSITNLSKQFNVNDKAITLILSGERKSINNLKNLLENGNKNKEIERKLSRGEKNGRSKLKESEVKEIRELSKNNWDITSIANKFNIGKLAISRILNGKSWIDTK